jgi:carboxypeptidase C (cathepsin A)
MKIFDRSPAPFVLALLVAACSGSGGGGSSPPPATNPPPTGLFTDSVSYSSAPNASLPGASEITSVTHQQITLNGTVLNYTATVGHLSALSPSTQQPEASFFYAAYTLDGAAPGTRPVTFFYNGGPGSATVWLHLGSFGPKRIDTGEPNMSGTPPFPLVDNAESMLDISDLVFVDAIGTGYSQAIAPNTNSAFWGVDADAAVFRDFVMRYVAVNNRTTSPKFLYGESYGGPRTAVLADLLESAGVRLSGIVLQSPALDYNSNCGILDIVLSCTSYIPSYGAVGSWFGFSTPSAPAAQLPAFTEGARVFVRTQYEPAIHAFLAGGAPPTDAQVTQAANISGLARSFWLANPNRNPEFYRLNIHPGTLYGRYDGRVSIPNTFPPGQEPDPSSTIISPSFGQRLVQHLTSLGYTTPSSYTMLGNAIQQWNFRHDGRDLPDTVPDLAAAMTQNPRLKVLSVNGYHDTVTPFYTTELDLGRIVSPNVTVREYVGGHMTYLENSSRRAMKADITEFYRSALAN